MKSSLPGFVTEPEAPWHVRRGVGFEIKARIGDPPVVHMRVKRHGQIKDVRLSRAELRGLMALDRFTPLTDALRPLCEKLEACDLVYYARGPVARGCTGRPLKAQERVCLRDGIGITLAIEDGESICPWLFMPRRGALDDKTLCGLRLSSLEVGTEVYALDLYGEAREVRALRAVLPLLDGRASYRELLRCHADTAAVVSILDWLDDAGFLSAELPAPLFPGGEPEAYVCWLGHASVLVRLGGMRVLVDPLAMRRSDPGKTQVQAPFDFRRLPPVDLVCVTHGDNDHLNPPTLVRMPGTVPVVIPSAPADKRPYQVDMAEVLAFCGHERVHPLSPWQRMQMGGVSVTAAVFEGEDWGLPLQKATFVLRGPEGGVYFGADSACSAQTLAKVRAAGSIDFAFLGVSGCEEPLVSPPGFGYGEFYALWLPRARRNEWVRHTDGPKQAADAAITLAARAVFGYGNGGGAFMDMAHSDRGTHAELAALLRGRGEGVRVADLQLGVAHRLG